LGANTASILQLFLLLEQPQSFLFKENYVNKVQFLNLQQSYALQSYIYPSLYSSSPFLLKEDIKFPCPGSTLMAVLLPSSTSLQLPKKTYHAGPPPLPSYPYNPFLPLKPVRQKPVKIQLKRKEDTFRPLCVGTSHGPEEPHHHSHLVPLSPLAAVADDFYSSLNEKNHHRLHELIADDCVFEDLTFSKPFKGKVMLLSLSQISFQKHQSIPLHN